MFVQRAPSNSLREFRPAFNYFSFCPESSFSTGPGWLTMFGNKGCDKPQLSTLCTSSQDFKNQMRYVSGRRDRALALIRLHYLGHLAESGFSF